MQAIVELPEFKRMAASLISEDEKQVIINYLARHPKSGVVMKGSWRYKKIPLGIW